LKNTRTDPGREEHTAKNIGLQALKFVKVLQFGTKSIRNGPPECLGQPLILLEDLFLPFFRLARLEQ